MKSKKKKKIITISMDEDVIKKIDDYSESIGVSRSSFLAMVAMERINEATKSRE